MKKIFALLASVTVLFTACEATIQSPASGPDSGDESNPNLKVKLESESVMHFASVGGSGTISYSFEEVADDQTRTSPVPIVATATTTVEWINNFQSNEDLTITFDVLANEDMAERSANIKVAYGEYSFYVRVSQQGVAKADVTFTATHLGGSYWGKYITSKGFNYFIILGDKQAAHYQTKLDGATEYRFDLYSSESSPFATTHRVPVGTYKIDHARTGDPGTIDGYRDCSYLYNDSNVSSYIDATLVVTEDSIIADITFADGQVHHVEYHGECVMEDYIEDTFADVHPVSQYTDDITFDIDGGSIHAYFRGDHYGIDCDVWFFDMIESKSPYNGVYLIFDLIVPKSLGGLDNQEGFLGEFTIHNENTESYEYTVPVGRLRDDSLQMHAWYLYCVESQVDMSKAAPLTSGSIKVTKDGGNITFDINATDDNGNKIVGTFTGVLSSVVDQSCE